MPDPLQTPSGDATRITVSNVQVETGAFDFAGARLVASIGKSPGTTPLIVRRNDLAGGSAAEIDVQGTGGGPIVIPLPSQITRGLRGVYFWDLVAQVPSGDERTIASGQLEFVPRVTRSIP